MKFKLKLPPVARPAMEESVPVSAPKQRKPFEAGDAFRDRIVGFKRIPANRIRKNKKNWRGHPEVQRDALREVFNKVGIADAALVVPVHGDPNADYELVDGHMRKELIGSRQPIPALVLDLNPAEADLVLASMDPIASLARIEGDQFTKLLADIGRTDNNIGDTLTELFSTMAQEAEALKRIVDEGGFSDWESEFSFPEGQSSWGNPEKDKKPADGDDGDDTADEDDEGDDEIEQPNARVQSHNMKCPHCGKKIILGD